MVVLADSDLNTSEMEDSKARKKTSPIWKYCEALDSNFARCNICDHKLSYKSSVTNLRKHFKKKHPQIVIPATMLCVKNGVTSARDSDDGSEDERSEIQRAANSVISEFLRPTNEERPFITRVQSCNYSNKQDQSVKRESVPERYDCRRDFKRSKNEDETEFDLFGRSVVMQLKQLPLVHAIELQAEITNLICQKRIQALRQSHQTNTEETPMQYTLVYANPETLTHQVSEEVPTSEVVKEASTEENAADTHSNH